MTEKQSEAPVEDRKYRYPPSKNPYWSKLKALDGRVYWDHRTEEHAGKTHSVYKSPAKRLEVEIGCNAGHWILERAKQNPLTHYVGIDWKFKAIHRAFEKAEKRQLDNLLFYRAHAQRIHYMFGEEEIDSLYIFFPDPWPKKAHHKHRLIQPQFLTNLHSRIAKNGLVQIKTDHRKYFDAMLEAIDAVKDLYVAEQVSFDYYKDHPNATELPLGEVTLFERLFIKDRLPIHHVVLKKR